MKKRISETEWVAQEEFFTTSYLTIDLIRKYCKENKWYSQWKAIDLFLFYAKCCSIQETKKIFCSTRFAAEWLWYTTDTITKYKKLLESIGCVVQECKRDKEWKIDWWYILIKYAISPKMVSEWLGQGVSDSAWSGLNRDLGSEGQNTVWVKDKILDESNVNAGDIILDKSNIIDSDESIGDDSSKGFLYSPTTTKPKPTKKDPFVNEIIEHFQSECEKYWIIYCSSNNERQRAKNFWQWPMQKVYEKLNLKDAFEFVTHVMSINEKLNKYKKKNLCCIKNMFYYYGEVLEWYRNTQDDNDSNPSSAFSEHIPIPTLQECLDFFTQNGYIANKGKDFFHYYWAKLWKDNKWNPIWDRRHTAQLAWFKEENEDLWNEDVKTVMEERISMKWMSDWDWNCHLDEVIKPKYGKEKRREMNGKYNRWKKSDQNTEWVDF